MTKDIEKRAKKITFLLMDVDGVLTPGYMVVMDSGRQAKVFDVHDGLGIMLWHKAGLRSAIITAGCSPAIKHRADALKIDKVYQNATDKLIAYDSLKKVFSVNDEEICFIGDDLVDVPILKRAGLACSVSSSHDDIDIYAHYKCRAKGGRGAVREVTDMILKAKGLWHKVARDYLK